MSSEQNLPIRVDLTGEDAITQGSYWRREFALAYGDGTLWDTAGFEAFMRIRSTIDGPTMLDLHSYNGRISVGIQGTAPYGYNLALTLTHSQTESLAPWGKGVYDLLLRDLSGRWHRVLEGNVTLSPMVTPPF